MTDTAVTAEAFTDATEQVADTGTGITWKRTDPYVQACLTWIKRKGGTVTAEELVAWDFEHQRMLFDWNSETAAEQWRLHSARVFLNSFRGLVNGLRIRAFIHIPANEDTGTERPEYMSTTEISERPTARAWVLQNLRRRIETLASEIKLWIKPAAQRRALLRAFARGLEIEDELVEAADAAE